MKILLADDSKFMRTILKNILTKAMPDLLALEAGTGNEALALYREHTPDLLLLDLVMPEKGGIEVLQELGKAPHGKVIIISALGQDKVMEEAIQLGAAAFIVKPFDEKKVIETVKTALGI